MNYEEMSDKDINKLVFEACNLKPDEFDIACENLILQMLEADHLFRASFTRDDDYYGKDYCNNPADMWPIILENDISLINDKGFYYATNNCYETFEPHGLGVADGYFYSKAEDKSKLLRAAAIVFLMMKDAEKA